MAVLFVISIDDMNKILQSTIATVGSDGKAYNAEADREETTHPRSYGTFPRILGRFVRDEKVLDLETVIYKMTGLAAERLRLKNRGRVSPGKLRL